MRHGIYMGVYLSCDDLKLSCGNILQFMKMITLQAMI